MAYDLHIVRTEDWTEAANAPVTKQDVDTLIAGDSELAWSKTDYVDMKDDSGRGTTRYYMITWRGKSRFWWYRDQIRCSGPDDEQTAKLVQMARALNAYAVGDEGEIYPVEKKLTTAGAPPAVTVPQGRKSRPLWKQLVAAFLLGCVLLGLKILVFGK
jgi:hypothetical protein